MKLKIALAGVILAGFVLPAAAQSTTTFYVVQDPATKHCQVVDVKPTSTETTVIGGDGQVYTTRTEADGAMGVATVCTTNH